MKLCYFVAGGSSFGSRYKLFHRRKSQFHRRKGATAVEFALVMPFVILLFFGAITIYGMLMTQNTLTAASGEGGRLAMLPSVTSEDAIVAAVEERLQQGGVDPALVTIEVNPAQLTNLVTGDEISISVSMPMRDCTWIPLDIISPSQTLTAETTYIRE